MIANVTAEPNDTSTDKELWNLFRSGEASALFELYKRLYIPLVNYGYGLSGDKDLAQDAFSDLMISLWDKRERMTEVNNVKSYLTTALKHQLLADFKVQDRFISINEEDGEPQISYEDLLINSQEQEALKKLLKNALSKLTPRQTQFITMRFYQGLSYQEIADIVDVDIKAVYNKVYEGIQTLRKQLPEKYNNMPDLLILFLIAGTEILN